MSSIGKVNYAIRPAKNTQRRMFCEMLGKLSVLHPLESYRYVGFGSIGFHDFSLFHRRLGIRNMISIEKSTTFKERVEWNIPYKCIQVKWGTASQHLPSLDWKIPSIIWLDYDSRLNDEHLSDIITVIGSAPTGSFLVVTCNVEPEYPQDDIDDIMAHRLECLQDRVGIKNVPIDVKGKNLSRWGLAAVSRRIISNQILATLVDRNAPQKVADRVEYSQLINFRYQDGSTRMLSVGGAITTNADRAKLGQSAINDLVTVRKGDEAFDIDIPVLTWKELRLLDKLLPDDKQSYSKLPKWLSKDDAQKYAKIYRHFQNFVEVES